MQPVAQKFEFADMNDKNKMIERFKKEGRVFVKFTFRSSPNDILRKSLWCHPNTTLIKLDAIVREAFKLPESGGVFFYINRKIPQKGKPISTLLKNVGGEFLSIDVATAEMF